MATTKTVKANLKLIIPAAAATPAPPVGPALGQAKVNIIEFCKQFNALTANRRGERVPTVITVYTDSTFDIRTKTASVTDLIKKKINLDKGSSRPNTNKVGKISWADIEDIAKVKLPDLNATDIEQAKKIIAGSARSMGVVVV